ncbi:LmeA family phospholipid-binding protein [Streptomyces milbemycinicus]|uniref:LmeA family phospholipid-binding protein n=1 Tax=Streptomyces milbemycinicus TaxID=476552 RepID=UPI0033F5126B
MRALRITAIVFVVLGILFVAADRLAVYFAESEAADKIKTSQGLTNTPDVSIKGFPFLTQVAGKELDEVEIGMDGLTTDAGGGRTVRVTKLNASLHNVRISSSFSSATADSATGSAHISYADLSTAAGQGITVGYAGKDESGRGRVKITGQLMGLSMSTYSTVTIVNGDTIRMRAESVPGSKIPGWEEKVRQRTDIDRKIDGLPTGMRLDKVETDEDGVDVSVVGNNVELAG